MTKLQMFLENQKRHMLQLDGASEATGWLTEKELKGKHFSYENSETGQRRGMMDILYENQIKWLCGVAAKTGRITLNEQGVPQPLMEDTLSTAIATITTSLLPAVRRLYQSMFGMELVSVQPLPGPSGYIYYLDHKYATTYADSKDTIVAGDRLDQKRPVDYAASSEKGTIRKINFGLTKKLVETVSQKIGAEWTVEAEQDLASQWKLNLQSELIPELTNECVRETDRRIVEALYAGIAYTVNWNKNGKLGAGTDLTADAIAYRQTLYTDAITTANAYVLKKKFIPLNYAVMNPDTFVLFQRLQNFQMDSGGMLAGDATIGMQYVGTLSGMIKCYVAPWFYDNKILLGIKGSNWKYACGYYAPYIPLFISDKYIISDDFTQFAQGAMSRYGYGILPEAAADSTTNDGLVCVNITSS